MTSKLEQLLDAARKPRTTVAKFAIELKERLTKVEVAFTKPGQEQFCAAIAYARGVVDAALSDFDVRDPGTYTLHTNCGQELMTTMPPHAALVSHATECASCGGQPRSAAVHGEGGNG